MLLPLFVVCDIYCQSTIRTSNSSGNPITVSDLSSLVKMQSLPYSGCLYSENKQSPIFIAWSLIFLISSSMSPQYQARDYFVDVEHQSLGKTTQPGAPLKMSRTPWQIKRPAPFLGEHNMEVYGKLLGYEKGDLVRLRQAGII